jgi:hypothetical protein
MTTFCDIHLTTTDATLFAPVVVRAELATANQPLSRGRIRALAGRCAR